MHPGDVLISQSGKSAEDIVKNQDVLQQRGSFGGERMECLNVEALHLFLLAVNEFRALVEKLTSRRNKRFVSLVKPISLEKSHTMAVLEC
jgi:hypothetical protein